MGINPIYETFGREIAFEEMSPIKKIYQPGMLDHKTFFNPEVASGILDFTYTSSPREILVYFRNISGGIGCGTRPKGQNWWGMMRDFKNNLGENFPAGIETDWYFEEKSPPRPDFDGPKKPYQVFVKLFGNALQFFSCFVRGPEAGIDFGSERTNYHTIKPGEAFIHDQKTLWVGEANIFLNSITRLHNTLEQMNRDHYAAGVSGYNFFPPEMRIISPKRGALVSRLVGSNSITILVDELSIEKIISEHEKRKKDSTRSIA